VFAKTSIAISLFAVITALVPAFSARAASKAEWRAAFNDEVTHGTIDVEVPGDRIDILTEEHSIAVERAGSFRAGVKQALLNASLAERAPGLALYIDGDKGALQSLEEARALCASSGVKLWLINEYVSHEELSSGDGSDDTDADAETHWLNEDSSVRHNRECRWFGNTGNGRYCDADEGRACRQCGG
jgi:hypothetical protein